MAEHQVLARKYRPRRFEEVIGQEGISRTLSLALDSDKLSHAYLFSGLRGSGKTSTARIFAKALLCEKGVSAHPCDVCEQCVQANESRHMDIIEMDAASNRRIDDVRDLIEQTRYTPGMGRFKIFIIDEVHMLTKEAFNALLKTLEEPPPFVKFILATTDPLKLPATILSRTQHFRFRQIAHQDVINHLMHILSLESVDYDPPALEMIARSGGGSLRDTLTLLDQAIIYGKGSVSVEATVSMLGILDPASIEAFFDLIFQRDSQGAIEFVRDLENSDAQMVIDELIIYLKERLYQPGGHFSLTTLERFFRIASQMKGLLFQGADGGFVLGLMTLKFIEALRPEAIGEAIARLEQEILSTPAPAMPAATPTAPVTPATPPPAAPAAPPSAPEALFNQLVARISDRSAQLGTIFARSIRFDSLEGHELRWMSCAEGDDRQRLKQDYGVIRLLVQEIFGVQTKIVNLPCPESEKKTTPQVVTDSNDSTPASADESPQEASGCMEATLGGHTSARENPDPRAILEHPTVQKAVELFEAKKVRLVSRV